MTIIWSNVGDNDTALLEHIWKGIDGVNVVELNRESNDIDETVMGAIVAEDDTLVFAGHGSRYGLYDPWLREYVFKSGDVGFVRAKNVFCIWCNASDFCKDNQLKCLATSMFISNVGEAYINSIIANKEEIDRCNIQFYKECNHCLGAGMSMMDMYTFLMSEIDDNSDLDKFNRGGLTLVGYGKSDYRERYDRIGKSEYFKKHYIDKSLGEVIPVLDDIAENQKGTSTEFAQLVNENFLDLVENTQEEVQTMAWIDGEKNGNQPGMVHIQLRCPIDGEMMDADECWYCWNHSLHLGCHLMHKPIRSLVSPTENNVDLKNKKKTWITRLISAVLGR